MKPTVSATKMRGRLSGHSAWTVVSIGEAAGYARAQWPARRPLDPWVHPRDVFSAPTSGTRTADSPKGSDTASYPWSVGMRRGTRRFGCVGLAIVRLENTMEVVGWTRDSFVASM